MTFSASPLMMTKHGRNGRYTVDERLLNALRILDDLTRDVQHYLNNPDDARLRGFVEELLEKYESGDAYDFVNETLYVGSDRI